MEGRAVVSEPIERVKQVGEDGMGWAVVPDPFLSRPSSSFSSSIVFFFSRTIFFFFLPLSREQWGGRWACRRLLCQGATCVAGASVAGGCG